MQAGAARTRFASEVVVVGDGWSALAAAGAARAAGKSVLLASSGAAVPAELTVALHGDVAEVSDPFLADFRARLATLGGDRDGWLDPPIAELVVDRWADQQGIDLLFYAVPVAIVPDGDRAGGVLMAGKDGWYVIAAGSVIDATADGALFARGVAMDRPAEVTAARTVYLQHATGVEGLPARHKEFALSGRATWPGEVCVTLTGSAAADGDPVPAALLAASRLALPDLVARLRAAVPGLAGAVVSHTGHQMLPLFGRRLAAPEARHPELANAFGAGAWVTGEGWGDPDRLAASGTTAGSQAAAVARQPVALDAPVPEPELAEPADVVVAGGGTGGPFAALAAGRQEATTSLVEAGWFLGGIGTGGGIHMYYHGVQGGLQEEIDQATGELADALGGREQVRGFSPEAKKVALERALRQAGARLRYGETVVDVTISGGRVAGLVCVKPGRVTAVPAAAVVDASGDGDVAALAGAEFTLGREKDGLNHAYSQSCGLMIDGKVGFTNFDAGFVDATDVTDLTRARRLGVRHYWRDEGFTPENRMLYLAPHLGLRQSRHVVGDYTLTLADQVANRSFADDVAYGSCHYDNHARDYENESDEGALWCWLLGHWHRVMTHGVPFRALLPAGVEGLVMACRALSVSHDAHVLFRMQRDMQRIGEAAGTAAALAARRRTTPRALDVRELRDALRRTGAVLDDRPAEVVADPPASLAARLAEPEPNLAVWQLAQAGDEAVPHLLPLLEQPGDARWWAAVALAALGRPEAEPALIEAVAQRDATMPFNRHAPADKPVFQRYLAPRWIGAIPLLGKIGGEAAVPVLAEVLADAETPPDALIAAIRSLGRVGDRRAAAVLEAVLDRGELPQGDGMQNSMALNDRVRRDVDWQIRLAAVEALAALGTDRAEAAEAYLTDERAYVRRYAHEVLAGQPRSRERGETVDHPVSGRHLR